MFVLRLIIAFLVLPVILIAQIPNRYSFSPKNKIKVIANGDSIINAWAGGMNYCQFNTIDLNNDGQEDLIVFDRTGNRLIPFVVKSNNGVKRYKYAPEYVGSFPSIKNWIILADYNCDGKKDIFTWAQGGIGVYKHTGHLNFKWALDTNCIHSNQNGMKHNLHVYSIDYPAIVDVDNDGDLDIFTFDMGDRVKHHEGLVSCGLEFQLKYSCWGGFEENGQTNKLKLDTCNGLKLNPYDTLSGSKVQHSVGSSLLLLDLEGNNLMDAIIGDYGFSNAVAVFNDGTLHTAHMYKQDTTYPVYNKPIDLYFPGFYHEDVDFDGKKDLIVTPSMNGYENINNTWFYKNISNNNIPNFSFQDSSFLQNTQIDLGEGSYPIITDIDFDGKQDLFVANYGVFKSEGDYKSSVSYYRNTGTTKQPEFTLQTTDFANLSTFNLGNGIYPSFIDLNYDGALDIMVGTEDGVLHYFEFDYSSGTPQYVLKTPNYGGIDVGGFSTPFFFDIDNDNDKDLFIGNNKGVIHFYRNDGTVANANFVFVTDAFGGVKVQNIYSGIGYSVPYFVEDNGTTNLFVGSSENGIVQFDSIEHVLNMPSLIEADFTNGHIPSPNHTVSLLGLTRKAGRNQILFKSDELKNKGLVYGYITSLSFNILNSGLPNVQYDGLKVSLKNVHKDSLTSFENGTTQAYMNIAVMSKGWLTINFSTAFLWDGESDLLIEFCFMNQIGNSLDAILECEDVGFAANAFADGTGSVIGTEGCDLEYAGNSHLRPNMKFEMRPAFVKTDIIVKEGIRNAASLFDFNDDGFMDAIVGNYSGGLTYYEGKKFNAIGWKELALNEQIITYYPNPTRDYLTLSWEQEELKSLDISVINLSGQVLKTQIVERNGIISTTDLENGLYIILASTDNQTVSQFKIVVLNE